MMPFLRTRNPMPLVPVGAFFDPNHGGCLRIISHSARRRLTIHGVYGSDEPDTGSSWTATATLDPPTRHGDVSMTVDFAGKRHLTHERIYNATWQPRRGRIAWQDGHTWTRMHTAPSMLRRRWTPLTLLLLFACVGLAVALAIVAVQRDEVRDCERELLWMRVRSHPPFNASTDRFYASNDGVWHANDRIEWYPTRTARRCHVRHVELLGPLDRTASGGWRLEDGLSGQ